MSAIKEYMMDEAEVLVHKMSKRGLSEEDLHFQFEHILTHEEKQCLAMLGVHDKYAFVEEVNYE
tara:strand:+ start:376 stop:567 length:192 start_codon:yes stop_codon:yes gene_type:complete